MDVIILIIIDNVPLITSDAAVESLQNVQCIYVVCIGLVCFPMSFTCGLLMFNHNKEDVVFDMS